MSEETKPDGVQGWLWATVVGIAGVLTFQATKSSTPSDRAEPTRTPRAAEAPTDPLAETSTTALDPSSLLRDYLPPDLTVKKVDPKDSKAPFTASLGNLNVTECLIATVPDPVDSRLGVLFDQVVESVKLAVEDTGYDFDRYWLPWGADRDARKQKSSDAARNSHAAGKGGSNLRETYPGILLFRKRYDEDSGPAVAIVFLVGENPTGGVDKSSLGWALDQMVVCQKNKNRPLRIVGPVFSGSQPSLRLALTAWRKPKDDTGPKIQLISGSATALDTARVTSGISFQATVAPLNLMLSAAVQFFQDGHASGPKICWNNPAKYLKDDDKASRIALLVEASTGYGARAESAKQKDKTLLELRFPMHISRLKKDFDQNRQQQDHQIGLPVPDPSIPNPSNEPESTQDVIPAQDPATTAAANALVLENIGTIIRREKIQLVGIVATDPRDKIFLALWLRERCPGVQLFIVESDLLLTNPNLGYNLKGTLVVSTYPLLPANQVWTCRLPAEERNSNGPPTDRKRIPFPSQTAQGTYNATMAQLGEMDRMIEYGPPLFRKCDKQMDKPPVWLTMISQSGEVVPVIYYSDYPDCGYVVAHEWKREVAKEEDYPRPFLVFVFVVCLLTGWVLVREHLTGSLLMFWEDRPLSEHRRGEAQAYRAVCLASLVFLLVPLAFLGWLHERFLPLKDFFSLRTISLLAACMPWLLLIWLLLILPRHLPFRLPAGPRWSWLTRVCRWPVFVGLACIGAGVYWKWFAPKPGAEQHLFFNRATLLSTGASPLLPLLFLSAVFFSWSFFHLRRISLSQISSIPNPFPESGHPLKWLDDFAVLHQGVADELASTAKYVRAHLVMYLNAALVTAAVVWGLSDSALQTVERFWWELVFIVGLVLGFFLTIVTLVRTLALWSRVRKLLNELARIPIGPAMSRIPERIRHVFGIPPFSQGLHLSHFLATLYHLRALQRRTASLRASVAAGRCATGYDPAKLELAEQLAGDLADELEKIKGDMDRRQLLELRGQFNKLTRSLTVLLAPFWRSRSVKEAFEGGTSAAGADAAPEGEWVETAEDVVALGFALYINQYMKQLRNFSYGLVFTSIFLVLASTSYPFHPEKLILYVMLGLTGAVSAAILYLLVQINKNELISRLAGSTPNRFTPDVGFLSSVGRLIVPLAGVFALQLSGTFRFLFEPILRALR